MVYDAGGFPDALMNDYLHYVAWQDHPPRRCYHEARELTQAATWLGFHGYTWRQADAGIWAAYCQDLTGDVPPDTRAISAADRQTWIRWTIGENPVVVEHHSKRGCPTASLSICRPSLNIRVGSFWTEGAISFWTNSANFYSRGATPKKC